MPSQESRRGYSFSGPFWALSPVRMAESLLLRLVSVSAAKGARTGDELGAMRLSGRMPSSRDLSSIPGPFHLENKNAERVVMAFSESLLVEASISKRGGLESVAKQVFGTLGFITLKISAMVFVQRLNQVTLQVQELEKDQVLSDDIELMDILSPTRHQHELNVWKGFLPRVKVGVFFELNVAGVFQMLEHAARSNLSHKTARALTKNVAASAVRKTMKAKLNQWTISELFAKVCRSTFRAQTLYWSAIFIVSVAFDAISSFNGNYKQGPIVSLIVPRYRLEGSFLRRTWVIFVDCSKKCLLTAVGASIGTLIRPGLGTTIGMVFFPSLAGVPK